MVDDEQSVTNVLSRFLTSLQYEVAVAQDGEEALEIVRKDPPDLILLDFHMPRIGGLEFMRNAKLYAPGVPIIMVTGVDDEVEAKKTMELGAVDYVTKPFDLTYLEDSIKANLISKEK